MTKQEAIDLVFDLVSAVRDYEFYKDRYYRAAYEEIREKVIEALTQTSASGASDE